MHDFSCSMIKVLSLSTLETPTLVDNNLKANRKDIIDPRKTILVSF